MATRPNVLLIFSDQFRFDAIHATGNPVIRTPNLDRIAHEGVAFTSAFSPSPVCVPARCCMTYGQYAWRTQCVDNSFRMPEDRPSFMDVLTAEGYRTHGIGKCHFTPDPHALRGFQTRERQEELVRSPEVDEYLQFLHASGFGHITDPHGVRGEMYYVPQPAQMPASLHPTNWIGDRTVSFMEEQAKSDQPWFLFSSFVHPHPPFCPPAPWHKLYRAPLMPLPILPPDYQSLWTHVNRNQNRYKYRDQGLDLNLLRVMKAYYYGCVSFIDYQIGRMLDALERTGQLENTLVLFTADHGEHLGDRGCFGKRSMHDSCARIPMLAWQPGRFEGGATCDTSTSLVDIAPTILNATGAGAEKMDSDGVDLAQIQSGASDRDTVYSQYGENNWGIYMAVNRRFKYFYSAPDNQEFLFDRREDPQETRNRAGVVFSDGALRDMRAHLINYLAEHQASEIIEGERWVATPRHQMPANPDAQLGCQDHPWADQSIPGYTDADDLPQGVA